MILKPICGISCSTTHFRNTKFQREDKGGRKRGRGTLICKRNITWLPLEQLQPGTWPTTQACALTRNQAHDLLVCRTTPNPLNNTSQRCDSCNTIMNKTLSLVAQINRQFKNHSKAMMMFSTVCYRNIKKVIQLAFEGSRKNFH